MQKPLILIFTFCYLVLLSGCKGLQDLTTQIQKPDLAITDVRVTDFNFSEMELTYDVQVKNPNALSLQMLAYNYNLDINGNTLVRGDQQKKIEIQASGESTVEIPMTLNFSNVYNMVQGLQNEDEASYNFLSNLTFELPVLGSTTIPVNKKGTIPLLKMPEIRIENFSVSNVSLSGASVNINLQFNNPNGFDININSLDYKLFIDGNRWADGITLEDTKIQRNGVTEVNIPISLNFSEMGMSAYRILTGSQSFDYQVKGTFDLNAQHELMGETKLDFDRNGKLSL